MKFDSEGLWKHAANIAYFANKAFESLKAKNESESNVKAFIKLMNLVKGDCTKCTFINACTSISELVKLENSSFKDAVKYALSLPVKGEDDNDNMNFSYFATLVHFHLASFERDWNVKNEK